MKILRLLPCIMATMTLIVGACLHVNGQADTTMRNGHMRDHAAFKDDGSFISKNIQDNQKEIEMSQMAVDKSGNAQIKALAQQMVNDHTKMLQDLQKLQGTVGGAGNDMDSSGNNNMNMNDSGSMSKPGDTGTASNQPDMLGTKTSRSDDTSASMNSSDETNNMDSSIHNSDGMHRRGDMDNQAGLMNATGKEFDEMWVSHMLHAHSAKLNELRNASQNISNSELKSLVQQAIPKVKAHKDKLQQLNGGSNRNGSGRNGNKSGRKSGNTSGDNTNSSNSGTNDSDTK